MVARGANGTDDEIEQVIAYRNKNGKFKDFQDLIRIPGIEIRKSDAAKGRIEF
jgi:DNA uptake protein ComE-like DNA-binding protein